MTVGEDRWRLVERIQATMSLVEGHAEHTMDVIGAQLLPSLDRLRAAMNSRRQNRGLPWRVLERLLGLELKLRQYQTGRSFCDAVVAAGGPPALARAWESPATLPAPGRARTPRGVAGAGQQTAGRAACADRRLGTPAGRSLSAWGGGRPSR